MNPQRNPQQMIGAVIPIRDVVNNPNWQPQPVPDGLVPLTREEHLQYIASGRTAALAKNPALAAKVQRNMETILTRYPELVPPGVQIDTEISLPPQMPPQLPQETELQLHAINQAPQQDAPRVQADIRPAQALRGSIPFDYLITDEHPAFASPSIDAALITDEPDQATNDIDISADRQILEDSFAIAKADPVLYRAIVEQKEALGMQMFSDAQQARWYRVGRRKMMEWDEDFAVRLKCNLEVGLRCLEEERREGERAREWEDSVRKLVQEQVRARLEAQARVAEEAVRVHEAREVGEAGERAGAMDG